MDSAVRLDEAGEQRGVVVRDDEADFAGLREASSAGRRRGVRLRLVDTGKLTAVELEWLGQAGAEIYTSDLARRNLSEVVLISRACRRGGSAASFFHHGPLEAEGAEGRVDAAALREMAGSGVYLALSDKERPREPEALIPMAAAGRRGKSPMVYYHHRPVGPWLEGLAREGAWIHAAAPTPERDEDASGLRRTAAAAAESGQGLVLHVQGPVDPFRLEDLFAAGAYLVFETPPADFRSPLRPLEERAARRLPGLRAGYLYREFMR